MEHWTSLCQDLLQQTSPCLPNDSPENLFQNCLRFPFFPYPLTMMRKNSKNVTKILNQWSCPWLLSPCPHILQWWSCPWWSWWGSRPGSPSSPRTPFALSGQNIVVADFKLRVTLILLRTSSIAVGISSALAIGCPLDLSLDPSIYCWPRRISGINFFYLTFTFFCPNKVFSPTSPSWKQS